MLTDKEIQELIQDLSDYADVNDSGKLKKTAQVMAALHYHYLLEKQEADEQSKLVTGLHNKYNDLLEKVDALKHAQTVCTSSDNSTGSVLLLNESLNDLENIKCC